MAGRRLPRLPGWLWCLPSGRVRQGSAQALATQALTTQDLTTQDPATQDLGDPGFCRAGQGTAGTRGGHGGIELVQSFTKLAGRFSRFTVENSDGHGQFEADEVR